LDDVYHFKANSCATYTTAGTKCILEHKDTGRLYEMLPNYLYRNGVEVIWRTTNWGEPTINIENYLRRKDLSKLIENKDRVGYDEILLAGLKEQILASKKDKILIVLHTSTSHGPSYNKKYPKEFEVFIPVCESVELAKCSNKELINAYDNTIIYIDYILATLIEDLKELSAYKTSMIFISDHGESLGEKNLYMHGLPLSIAPQEQFDIPFIVWSSSGGKKIKSNEILSQHHIFHSVLDFLDIDSPVYDENMNIFE
jgi:lipid A ethanolaminephosphotransferase